MSKSKVKDPKRVKTIPIDQIRFLNPRVRKPPQLSRNRAKHR